MARLTIRPVFLNQHLPVYQTIIKPAHDSLVMFIAIQSKMFKKKHLPHKWQVLKYFI